MSRVSVIIPNFNHAHFLRRRIDSVLAQTSDILELIIMDDASTDGSLQVIQHYVNDPRVTVLFNEVNSGNPFVQWNKGVEAAGGEYIWIAESDDFCDPCFLETMQKILTSNPEVGLAFCQSWLVDEHSRKQQLFSDYDAFVGGKRWRDGFIAKGEEEVRLWLSRGNTIPNASAVVFRRSLYEQIGGAPTHLRLCGDWMTWARMLMRCELAFHPKALNCFRIDHAASQRAKAKQEALDVFEGLQVLRDIVERLELTEEEFAAAFHSHLDRWAMYAVAYRYPLSLNRRIYRQFKALRAQSGFRFPFRLGRHFLVQSGAQVKRMVGK
jgi:glycosyltransferase involved in cell wall biosynthesis